MVGRPPHSAGRFGYAMVGRPPHSADKESVERWCVFRFEQSSRHGRAFRMVHTTIDITKAILRNHNPSGQWPLKDFLETTFCRLDCRRSSSGYILVLGQSDHDPANAPRHSLCQLRRKKKSAPALDFKEYYVYTCSVSATADLSMTHPATIALGVSRI